MTSTDLEEAYDSENQKNICRDIGNFRTSGGDQYVTSPLIIETRPKIPILVSYHPS